MVNPSFRLANRPGSSTPCIYQVAAQDPSGGESDQAKGADTLMGALSLMDRVRDRGMSGVIARRKLTATMAITMWEYCWNGRTEAGWHSSQYDALAAYKAWCGDRGQP